LNANTAAAEMNDRILHFPFNRSKSFSVFAQALRLR